MNETVTPASYYDINIADSCTIFTSTIGDKVYFGNNEDYLLEGTYVWFIPSQERYTPSGFKQINGAVFFGFDNNGVPNTDGYPQGGMNDKGLCFDGNGLPPTPINYSSIYIVPYTHPFYEILWEYSTVNETIEWFSTHYFGINMECQIHFADATGDAVVVSVDAGGNFAFTRINDTYIVSTNFNLANIANGWYPCQRYETACSMLAEIDTEEELTVEACRDVLDAVHSEGQYSTKYSNVFDLVNQEMYIYHDRDYENVAKFNLADELAKIHEEDEDTETGHGVYYKSYRIADFMTMTSQSVPINSIILIVGIAGIVIINVRHTITSKYKSKKT
ncbi:MAG: hypothetical protein FK733_14505 [Asgard group archaeon]|nr:hypothetical protein [Asgard group archaeon]